MEGQNSQENKGSIKSLYRYKWHIDIGIVIHEVITIAQYGDVTFYTILADHVVTLCCPTL